MGVRKLSKKIFPITGLVLLLSSLLFFSCTDLSKVFSLDVDGIKNSIELTYEVTDTGSTFKWTKPSNLDEFAKYYLISKDSREDSSDGIEACFKVDPEYQHDSEIRIKKTVSSVDFTWRYISVPLYLWVVTDSKSYNLGEFTTTITDIEELKKQIVLNVDNSDINNLKFQWAFPNSININPTCFYISIDNSDYYATIPDSGFSCLIVQDEFHDDYYNDRVSIKRNCYTIENTNNIAYKVFDITASYNTKKDYYLWIQIEDGSNYNLGKFEIRNKVNIDTIRQNIKLSYSFSSVGSKVTWTTPSGLSEIAQFFVISEDSRTETDGGVHDCYAVDSQYRDLSYDASATYVINASLTSAEILKRPTTKIYLWVHTTDGNYNLGEFTTPTTDIAKLKQSIKLFSDPTFKESFNSDGYISWVFSNTISVIARRFVISKDSSNSYSSGTPTSCKSVKSKYHDDYYNNNDTVSIKADCYTDKEQARIYIIQAESPLTEGYYLWIQIEDGSWYNLGAFTANTTSNEKEITQKLDSIRKSIKLKSFLSYEGTTYCWSKPDGLEDIAWCYMISSNSSLEPTDTLSCSQIKDIYLDTSFNNKTSIKASTNYIDFESHIPSTTDLYLWFRDKTTGTAYNLGKFEAVETEISKLKAEIQIYGDPYGTGSYDPYGRIYWTIPHDVQLNIMRFIITDDSTAYYSDASHSFSCTKLSADKVHPLYNDGVSINPDEKYVQTNLPDLDLYRINVSPKLSSTKYLWVQIEDGSWYNLGGIPVKTADFSI